MDIDEIASTRLYKRDARRIWSLGLRVKNGPGEYSPLVDLAHFLLVTGRLGEASSNYVAAVEVATSPAERGFAHFCAGMSVIMNEVSFYQTSSGIEFEPSSNEGEPVEPLLVDYLRNYSAVFEQGLFFQVEPWVKSLKVSRALYGAPFEPRAKAGKNLSLHHLREAADSYRIHLASNPDDYAALKMLADAYGHLGRDREHGDALAKLTIASRGAGRKPRAAPAPSAVNMDWQGFEAACARLVERFGFNATVTKATGDGGVDIEAYNPQPLLEGKYLIQCKKWEAPVGEPPLRDLYGLVVSTGANKGILITTSTFTPAAKRFADGKPLELIDGASFARLLKQSVGVGAK